MTREIDDKDYIEFLPSLYRNSYFRWRERMIDEVEQIVAALESHTIEEVMEQFALTPRDVALLVRLNYVSPEEADRFDMRKIERKVAP